MLLSWAIQAPSVHQRAQSPHPEQQACSTAQRRRPGPPSVSSARFLASSPSSAACPPLLQTYYGQRVLLVGSSQELGAWKLDAGLPLRWSEEHKWSATVALPAGAAVEYKFVITDPEQ